MDSKLIQTYLLFAGTVMGLVGIYIGIFTYDYHQLMSPTTTARPVNLFSDLRGMGGLLITFGAFILISLLKYNWRQNALTLATVVYWNFVIFRGISFVLDGWPDGAIMMAFAFEIALALSGALLLIRETVRSHTHFLNSSYF